MRNIFHILAIVIVGGGLCFFPAVADDNAEKVAKEYQVKVAYLYNFLKFVEWPGDHSLNQTHKANICIIGTNSFGSALDIFKHVSSAQLEVNVIHLTTTNDISNCNILFVSQSEEELASPIIARAQNFPILTVSEINGFVDKGGIIEMVKVEKSIGLFSKDKINLRVNVKAAKTIHLKIDAQLLEIATEVIQ